jgi:arsenate reductase-like glutaredoxin family protein
MNNNFNELNDYLMNFSIDRNLNDNEKRETFENMINLVMKYPILLQRPIVTIERNNKIIQSIICRPTELIKSIFS